MGQTPTQAGEANAEAERSVWTTSVFSPKSPVRRGCVFFCKVILGILALLITILVCVFAYIMVFDPPTAEYMPMKVLAKGFYSCYCSTGRWPGSGQEAVKWLDEDQAEWIKPYLDNPDFHITVVSREGKVCKIRYSGLVWYGRYTREKTYDVEKHPCGDRDKRPPPKD